MGVCVCVCVCVCGGVFIYVCLCVCRYIFAVRGYVLYLCISRYAILSSCSTPVGVFEVKFLTYTMVKQGFCVL